MSFLHQLEISDYLTDQHYYVSIKLYNQFTEFKCQYIQIKFSRAKLS